MKKAEINPVLIFLLVIIGLSISMIIIGSIGSKNSKAACQRLGYESHKSTENFSFCVDKDDNLHYVKHISKGFMDMDYKEISVGDVRVIKND